MSFLFYASAYNFLTSGSLEVGSVNVRSTTAIANPTSQYAFEGDAQRKRAERLYNIQRWTPMERRGHFAPTEEPVALACDIAAFFAR